MPRHSGKTTPGPRPRTLSRAKIAAAALELARETGLSALSMRPVAASLGVDVAALYRHFENREDLLAEVSKLASEAVEFDVAATGTWQERTLGLCRSIRSLLLDHAELSLHGGGSPGTTPFNARAFGLLAGLLLEGGVREDRLMFAAQALLDEVTSIAENELLKRGTTAEESRRYRRTIYQRLPEDVRAAVSTYPRMAGERDFDVYFEFAIGALIDGIVLNAK